MTQEIRIKALEYHGHRCWASVAGVQYATGCTLGKGNMEKTPYGKLAVTLIERSSNRAVRVSCKPTLAKRIAASPFMVKRGQGLEPDDIPEAERLELVGLMRNAPESDVLGIGAVFQFQRDWLPEVMGFTPRAACHELTARAYVRVVGDKQVCIPCSGYER
jgi:formylmethanofuran dehydrogenase subunit E